MPPSPAPAAAAAAAPPAPAAPPAAPHDDVPEHVDFDGSGSKLKFVFGLLSRFVGVKDLVGMRISLPANLMEPESNLEFWNYQDRPDLFVDIPRAADPLDRMLRIIRWWYSKDTKWKENQLRKPYNPILGEQFICSWAVDRHAAPARAATDPTLPSETDPQAADPAAGPDPAFVRCVTEQISHHPPISAFTYTTDDEAIAACGLDHVVARFTGTSFKVGAGEYNAGVYVLLRDSGEEYNISHPWATVNGWLTGSPYIVVSDQVVIVCPKSGLKAVLEYKEESYFTRPKFAIEGKIFRHDYSKDAGWSDKERRDAEKLSKIPAADVLCTLSGAWNSRITYRMAGSTEDQLLFDMASSEVAPKIVRPVEEQDPLESRRVWRAVTDALHAKDYSTATKEKRAIEDRQRRIAAEHRAAIENQKHNHTHPAPAAEYESRFFDFKHDIKAGATVRGPPMDMTKGRPYLKPGVLAELFGKRE